MTLLPARISTVTAGATSPLQHSVRNDRMRSDSNSICVSPTVQIRFSRAVLRNYGNMSSPTVMFVLDEVVSNGDPRPGDWGIMVALGPGMAAEVALLRW